MQTFSTNQPDPFRAEVSLFGPGKGECVLVHLGGGDWIVVDSCVDQRTNVIPALEYLREIGVDPATQVRLIVASHAHDDHMRGISDVWRECSKATFVCANAISTLEFRALLELEAELTQDKPTSVYREFRAILDIARERRTSSATNISPIRRATWGVPLLEGAATAARPAFRVEALSPSDLSFERAVRAFESVLPTTDSTRHVPSVDLNELTVALWVAVGDTRILLGGDLVNGPAGCGWHAVVNTFAPDKKAALYKVAHHGSPNAHLDAMWDKLVEPECAAVLAPYRLGPRPRPDADDVARIKSRTSNAFLCAATKAPTLDRTTRRAASKLGPAVRNITDPWGSTGQVRWRAAYAGSPHEVDCRPPAHKL